jgi:eukaryotic-like serine/threonine-protein kinase
MKPDRWHKAKELYEAALMRPPDERSSFLDENCGGDEELRREVESLLSFSDDAGAFLEKPAVGELAEVIVSRNEKLAAGQRLSHYEIIKQIGAGGMGEVYLARDKKLDRQVAVKILNEKFSQDESNLHRFVREAKSASALNHPNILVIHEIGESEDAHFIVSEFVQGRTLREILRTRALELSEILDIAIQIANALSAAHESHLIHRDIKPENVIVRPDGLVKVLDFGLAKLVESKNELFLTHSGATVLENQTEKGVILGTVNYMSPEQAKGERVDERTDIFSLGAVIYEIICGQTPFAAETAAETFANLINSEPQPLSYFAANVPAEFERIVSKMLSKNKDERYRTMRDAIRDLKNLRENLTLEERLRTTTPQRRRRESAPLATATAAIAAMKPAAAATEKMNETGRKTKSRKLPVALSALFLLAVGVSLGYYFYASKSPAAEGKKSIAVLPLKPINASNRDEIYEIGIAESLIHRISAIKGFVARPLSAIRRYADLEQDPIAAGREQQVDFVLASTYQLANGKIRVTAQLLNVADGQVEETYKAEKDAGDVFAMQDAVADEVGKLLQSRFAFTSGTPAAMAAARGTDNEEAYRLYLQGMYFYDKRTRADAHKAVEVLEQALRLDPAYARAWAGLAHARRYLINLGSVDQTDIHEETRKSMEAVNKALELDRNVSEAYSALCDNKMYYEYDFAGAESACKRAIELKPNSPLARNTYGRFLMSRGRFDEAIYEFKTAIELEPTSYFHQIVYLTCLSLGRRYDEGFRQMDRIAELNPPNAFRLYWQNAGALMTAEPPEQAFARWLKYLKSANVKVVNTDEQPISAEFYEKIYQTAGWPGVMREQARMNKENPVEHKFIIAAIHAQVGDKETALEFLEKSYERREFWMSHLQFEPRLDSLRGDPRFEELIRRVEVR